MSSNSVITTRRELLALASTCSIAGLAPRSADAQGTMPRRAVPSTGEMLPVLGLGSSKPVEQIGTRGPEPLAEVLRTLVEHGGRVVDTWPRNPDNDAAFGRIINAPDLRDELFVTTKIDRPGKDAGLAQFNETQRHHGRDRLDLVQVFRLIDIDTHWPSLQELKATGKARYIGGTVAQDRMHDDLERFLERSAPDFIQVNYSITERLAEERILPKAADLGVAVIINRPFMNGEYLARLEGQALPEWAAEFDCQSWAQFSLKYILANPLVTCVLTETGNPAHMAENALASFGAMPDEAARARMRAFIQTI